MGTESARIIEPSQWPEELWSSGLAVTCKVVNQEDLGSTTNLRKFFLLSLGIGGKNWLIVLT